METKTTGFKGTQKPKTGAPDPKKVYTFQLVQTHEKVKPVDSETREPTANPYPPLYMVPSSGLAYDSKLGIQRAWRYVYNQPSIWLDEQTKPEPRPQDIAHERNDIIFRKGFLKVNGNNATLMQALMVQDVFEGNENPLENKPKVFRLIDEDKEMNKVKSNIDVAYEAETQARNAILEDMLPIASVFGIDVSNPDERADRIRTAFILQAKQTPEAFLKQFVNPRNKIVYTFRKALDKNIIKVEENKVIMVDSNRIVYEVNPDKDVAEQSASLVIAHDEKVERIYDQLERLLA